MLSLLQNTQKIAHIDLKVLKYNVFVLIFYKKTYVSIATIFEKNSKNSQQFISKLKKNTITGQRKPQKAQLLQNVLLTLIIKI